MIPQEPRTAYDMEMAYQDRLAERRQRAENRLWAREMFAKNI